MQLTGNVQGMLDFIGGGVQDVKVDGVSVVDVQSVAEINIPVQDVKVDGVSVVDDGIAEINIPAAPVQDVEVDGVSVVNDQGIAEITLPDVGVNYSTNEQVIGKWIDGKPIYQKTISIPSLNYTTVNVNKVVDTITNIDMIVNLMAVLSNSSKTVRRMLPYVNPTQTSKIAQIYYDYSNSNIIFNSSDTWSTSQLDVTIQYTKTTDD